MIELFYYIDYTNTSITNNTLFIWQNEKQGLSHTRNQNTLTKQRSGLQSSVLCLKNAPARKNVYKYVEILE